MVKDFRDLSVWQKSIELVKAVYALTSSFPKEEAYGLTSQLRRAVVSVPSNIAEGCERKSTKEYMRFLSMAKGSLAELHTQIIIACHLKFLKEAELETIVNAIHDISKMINGLHRSLSHKQP